MDQGHILEPQFDSTSFGILRSELFSVDSILICWFDYSFQLPFECWSQASMMPFIPNKFPLIPIAYLIIQ